jgi:hypothetical protein
MRRYGPGESGVLDDDREHVSAAWEADGVI